MYQDQLLNYAIAAAAASERFQLPVSPRLACYEYSLFREGERLSIKVLIPRATESATSAALLYAPASHPHPLPAQKLGPKLRH